MKRCHCHWAFSTKLSLPAVVAFKIGRHNRLHARMKPWLCIMVLGICKLWDALGNNAIRQIFAIASMMHDAVIQQASMTKMIYVPGKEIVPASLKIRWAPGELWYYLCGGEISLQWNSCCCLCSWLFSICPSQDLSVCICPSQVYHFLVEVSVKHKCKDGFLKNDETWLSFDSRSVGISIAQTRRQDFSPANSEVG